MVNRVNYFSMHRQILDQQRMTEAVLKSQAGSGKEQADTIEKLAEIKKGAEAFESYFIQTLLKEMRKGVPKGVESGVGLGDDLYQSMFDEAIAEKISETGGIGLAKMLSEKLSGALTLSEASSDPMKPSTLQVLPAGGQVLAARGENRASTRKVFHPISR